MTQQPVALSGHCLSIA